MDGQLGGQAAVGACAQPGGSGLLVLLMDKATNNSFLVDTGAVFSVIPFSSSSPPTGPKINSVDASPIPCWGWANRKLKAGGMWFQWKFLNAKVAFPILGANFLASFNLLVDLRHSHLVWGQLPPNHLATPAGGSPYCKCGFLPAVVVVDSPSLAGAVDSSSSAVAVDSSSSAVAVVPSLSPLQENHLR